MRKIQTSPLVIPCHPREGGGQAGIQSLENALDLSTPLDSRIRGNDGTLGGAR